MKKWWKRLELRLEGVSHGKKLAVNLVLCAFVLLLLWSLFGYPLPTAELEFRRMERTNLIPRSEIVFSNGEKSRDLMFMSKEDGSVYAVDGTELHLRGRWIAGVGEKRGVLACLHQNSNNRFIRSFPLEDGPTLIPFARWDGGLDDIGYWFTEGQTEQGYEYHYHGFLPFLLLNAPEETFQAELTIRWPDGELSGGGWQLADKIWLMCPESSGNDLLYYKDVVYALALYREDGSSCWSEAGRFRQNKNKAARRTSRWAASYI